MLSSRCNLSIDLFFFLFFSLSLSFSLNIRDGFAKPCDEHGAYIVLTTVARKQTRRNLNVNTSNIRTRQSQNPVQRSKFQNFMEDEIHPFHFTYRSYTIRKHRLSASFSLFLSLAPFLSPSFALD